MSKRAAFAFPAVLIALLAWAGSAGAATISRTGTTVTYTAAPGEANNVAISATQFGYRFVETGTKVVSGMTVAVTLDSSDLVPGGCLNGQPNTITCPIPLGITSIVVAAGDGIDIINASGVTTGFGFPALVGVKIDGGTGGDTLTGGAGADELTGGDGVDTLNGGAGADQIRAADGLSSDTVDCGPGDDLLDGDPPPFDPGVNCEQEERPPYANVSIVGDTVVYTLFDGTSQTGAADLLVGFAVATITSPPEIKFTDSKARLVAGSGCTQTSVYVVDCPPNPTVAKGEIHVLNGNDAVDFGDEGINTNIPFDIEGGGGNDRLVAGNRSTSVDAGPGDDTVRGGEAADLIEGGLGDDTLSGGDTADIVNGGPGTDLLMDGIGTPNGGTDAGLDDFNGGDGTDTYSSPTTAARVSLDGVRNDGVNSYTGVPTTTDNVGTDIEVVIGGTKPDILVGNDQPNTLIGLGDNDFIDGRGGDDALLDSNFLVGQPGEGQNVIEGGDGNDLLGGGPIADQLLGGAGQDTIAGFAGDDVLDGGPDAGDQLLGGTGADTFRGGAGAGDAVIDYANAASPVAVSIDGSANDGPVGERDYVIGDVEVILGSPFDDVLVGDGGNQTLDGGAGDDSLDGRGGADLLLGRAGSDDLFGGPGNDSLDGGAGDDHFDGGTGADTIGDAGGGAGGTDEVDYSGRVEAVNVSQDGAANDGASGGAEGDNVLATVERLFGGQGDDVFEGSSVANIFTGGMGNDALSGGGGNDQLSGGDADDTLDGGTGPDSLSGGAGEDRASYANRGAGVHASPDDAANDGEPGEGDNVASDIEQLQGGSGSDTLIGNSAVNTLLGEDGDDRLFGGENFDLLLGGSGNDELRGEGGPDTLKAGDGNDTADGGEGEDLVLGEGGDDSVVGGGGVDNLNAGIGADAILSKDGVVDIVSCGTDTDPDKLDTDPNDAISDDCSIPAVESSFVSLSIRSARASRSGSLTVAVTCRRIQQACTGTLSLETASKVKAKKRGKKRKIALGSTKFNIAPTKTAKLKLKLSKTAQRALKRLKRFSVRATASGQGAKSSQQIFTLSGPKAKKKGKR